MINFDKIGPPGPKLSKIFDKNGPPGGGANFIITDVNTNLLNTLKKEKIRSYVIYFIQQFFH